MDTRGGSHATSETEIITAEYVYVLQFSHLEVRVENHDLLGRDEEVDLRGRLVLALGRLRMKNGGA